MVSSIGVSTAPSHCSLAPAREGRRVGKHISGFRMLRIELRRLVLLSEAEREVATLSWSSSIMWEASALMVG